MKVSMTIKLLHDECQDDDCNEECKNCEEVYDKDCEEGDDETIENDATTSTSMEFESDCEGDTSVSV